MKLVIEIAGRAAAKRAALAVGASFSAPRTCWRIAPELATGAR